MKHDEVMPLPIHPLEFNEAERGWFLNACRNYVTAYRRAVQALTGSLPTWAERQSAGRPLVVAEAHHTEIRELLALGVPVSKLASRYNTSRATIARIRNAKASR